MITGSNIVEEVPVLRVKVSPASLAFVTLSKDDVHDEKIVLHTFAQEKDDIGIGFLYSFLLSDATPEFQVIPDWHGSH